MDTISIHDLEVAYSVGITAEERARPQRLLLTLHLTADFALPARTDRIRDTIYYFDISQRLLKFGEGRSWNLLEKLAVDIAELVLKEYKPISVSVLVKKFPLPAARHVSVCVTRPDARSAGR